MTHRLLVVATDAVQRPEADPRQWRDAVTRRTQQSLLASARLQVRACALHTRTLQQQQHMQMSADTAGRTCSSTSELVTLLNAPAAMSQS